MLSARGSCETTFARHSRCKACSLGAYEAIAGIDGVEQATTSFKEGKVTALIEPTKTDHAKLEDGLRKRGVTVTKP